MAAEDVLGPNLESLKGKTVRWGGPHVSNIKEYLIPQEIMEKYRDVTICADIIFINKIPFLVTISRGIKFEMEETLANRKQATVVAAFKSVKGIYARRGFQV
jgi:hypothetical protein